MTRRWRWLAGALALVLLALLFAPGIAVARPGGGESYSGGGDSGGDGGGGGGGAFVWLLIRLWIEFVIAYPYIGIPLTILGIWFFMRRQKKRQQAGPQTWDSAPRTQASAAPPVAVAAAAAGSSQPNDLDGIRRVDPEFSVVLFEDFVYALFAKAHQARSTPRDLESLSPYLSQPTRSALAQRAPAGAPVHGVVIGAMRVLSLSVPADAAAPAGAPPAQVTIVLEFEANMTVGAPPSEQTQYVRERWRLVRDASVKTKADSASEVRSFHCPNCGAPFGPEGGDRCEYCGQVVSGGRFDWSVESVEVVRIENRPPALTGTQEEVGTSWPTVFHPAVQTRRAELLRDDPATTDAALAARLKVIYDSLNAAWTSLDLKAARPYLSDGLFDYLLYWTQAYEKQGLRNVLEGMRLVESVLAKVVRDRHYDSLTFRIWGSGRDSTLRQATGDVVAGNPKVDRFYSEYWTLIRSAGVKGVPRTDASCPNCGASLDQVNMAGECGHCGAKITRGGFDWVLSKIEQDDSYTG